MGRGISWQLADEDTAHSAVLQKTGMESCEQKVAKEVKAVEESWVEDSVGLRH
jgi:hypothetical protein